VGDYLNFEEKDKYEQILISKQKTGADWDNIKSKLPESFLDKLKNIVKECWENGFCNPRVNQGKLVWSQVMGDSRNHKYQEKCDLCRNTFQSGQCKGHTIYSLNGQRNFKKCWEV
jgi:hypothetical protein